MVFFCIHLVRVSSNISVKLSDMSIRKTFKHTYMKFSTANTIPAFFKFAQSSNCSNSFLLMFPLKFPSRKRIGTETGPLWRWTVNGRNRVHVWKLQIEILIINQNVRVKNTKTPTRKHFYCSVSVSFAHRIGRCLRQPNNIFPVFQAWWKIAIIWKS